VLQEFTEFRYTSDLPANGQPGEVRFTYLPEGMEEQYREQDAIEFYVYYESPDGDCMDLSQIDIRVDWVGYRKCRCDLLYCSWL